MDVFASFELSRVLSTKIETKQISLLGILNGQEVLLRLTATTPNATCFTEVVETTQVHSNDVYSKYDVKLSQSLVDCEVLKPDLTEHGPRLKVVETAETYRTRTKAYIESLPTQSPLECVFSGAFSVYKGQGGYEVRVSSLQSLRDLEGRHLELLLQIKAEAPTIVAASLGISPFSLLVSTQYPPEESQLIFAVSPSSLGLLCSRSFLLNDIISDLSRDPEHFQRTTLIYLLPASHPLA
jgi:hypothetical protein